MKKQAGMTLIEVMVATGGLRPRRAGGDAGHAPANPPAGSYGRENPAGWLADNQLVQLRLENRWPALSWSETTVQAAGVSWHIRWQGVETDLPQLRALDVEVRRAKSDKMPVSSLRTYVTPP